MDTGPMRIGMFADMYKPHISGVTNYISMYKSRFEECGHEVFVFTYGNRSHVDDESGIIRSPAIPWGDTGWQMGLKVSKEAKRLISSLDIAHVHHPFVSGRVAIRECKTRRTPVVFTNHCRYHIFADEYARFIPRKLRMALLGLYLNDFAHKIDLYLAPSTGTVQWLQDMGVHGNIVLHHNVVNTEPFLHPANPRHRTEFGWNEDDIVYCHVGRLSPEKNIDSLIQAFAIVAHELPKAKMLLIGDGPQRDRVHETISAHSLQDRVHFSGAIPYELMPDLLAAADVFVITSVSETYPLVIMEALAAGLPAIGMRSVGVSDIIVDGVTGLLTSTSVTDFAASMIKLGADDVLRSKMSGAARTDAIRFDIRPAADRLIAHYDTLIAAARSKG